MLRNKWNLFLLALVILTFGICKCDFHEDSSSSSSISSTSLYCGENFSQNSLSLPDIMGMWYGSEIITHQDDHDNLTGTYYYETCVVVHLSDITEQITRSTTTLSPHRGYNNYARIPSNPDSEQRYLRLIWDESGDTLEYLLRYNNSRRGFWLSTVPQSGTMLGLNRSYRQFYGTIQVMKAVGDHLVLTFCKNMPESLQYSVILSRRPNTLSDDDLNSIHGLLRRRELHTVSIRKVCFSGASSNSFSSIVLTTVISMTVLLCSMFLSY